MLRVTGRVSAFTRMLNPTCTGILTFSHLVVNHPTPSKEGSEIPGRADNKENVGYVKVSTPLVATPIVPPKEGKPAKNAQQTPSRIPRNKKRKVSAACDTPASPSVGGNNHGAASAGRSNIPRPAKGKAKAKHAKKN